MNEFYNKDELNIEIGIYCPKCHTFHPTLTWHERYEDYLDRNVWIEKFMTNSKKIGIEYSNPNDYIVFLEQKGLYASKNLSPCAICNELTGFTSDATGNAVCSDACKDVDKNNAIDVMKYARLKNQDTILIKYVNRRASKVTGTNIYEKDKGEVEVSFDDICMVFNEICKSITVE